MQYTNLGKFIKSKRLLSGESLNRFAFRNDIEPAILSRIENEKQDIKFATLAKIAEGFGLHISDLIKEFELTKE